MNNYEKAVKELAPCGIDCSRCASFNIGNFSFRKIKLYFYTKTKFLYTWYNPSKSGRFCVAKSMQ